MPALPNVAFSQPSSSGARLPPPSGAQLAPPVPGTGAGRVAQQAQVLPQRTQGENQLLATGLDVDQLASEGFKPEDCEISAFPIERGRLTVLAAFADAL